MVEDDLMNRSQYGFTMASVYKCVELLQGAFVFVRILISKRYLTIIISKVAVRKQIQS